jgi:hypothetical protein
MGYSGWEAVRVVQGGESFTALTEGLQEVSGDTTNCPPVDMRN